MQKPRYIQDIESTIKDLNSKIERVLALLRSKCSNLESHIENNSKYETLDRLEQIKVRIEDYEYFISILEGEKDDKK